MSRQFLLADRVTNLRGKKKKKVLFVMGLLHVINSPVIFLLNEHMNLSFALCSPVFHFFPSPRFQFLISCHLRSSDLQLIFIFRISRKFLFELFVRSFVRPPVCKFGFHVWTHLNFAPGFQPFLSRSSFVRGLSSFQINFFFLLIVCR